jgi:uracil-DNA glycosylase
MSEHWQERGVPWEYDPGPPKNRKWPRLFAETPNYRQLSKQVLGKERFRWHFGPMFYRGRLQDNKVKVLVIGQEGAQDESLAHRSFTGGSGARMQHFLNHIGITESYLFLNTFVYPIFGQYDSELKWLAQNPDSPIVQHRHAIFDYVAARNEVQLVVAVGNAAKESVVTWITSRGGDCPDGTDDLTTCAANVLNAKTKAVGVLHPGGASFGSVSAIIQSFQTAVDQIKVWAEVDPTWLLSDEDGVRQFEQPYKYKSAPIPFRDFSYGVSWRLGRGGTSSNRKDSQRAIQLFSAGGHYNNDGDALLYPDKALGDPEGYKAEVGDLAYEPPKKSYLTYDKGPGPKFAELLMGAKPGLQWPDFAALGLAAHPSLGYGPIYRGRLDEATLLILADQQSQEDLFTGRALTGEAGQRLQAYLEAIGILSSYVILRVLPVNSLDASNDTVTAVVTHPQTIAVYQAIIDKIREQSHAPELLLTVGSQAKMLGDELAIDNLPIISLKGWSEVNVLADWQQKLGSIQQIDYQRDVDAAPFSYDGQRGQIPRIDLPFGCLRWQGSSGSRGVQAVDEDTSELSPHYFKHYMPQWAAQLDPEPLTDEEVQAIELAP